MVATGSYWQLLVLPVYQLSSLRVIVHSLGCNHWLLHKAICKGLSESYSGIKKRIAPARALERPVGPWEYPPSTRGVMLTIAEIGIDQYQFMKVESEEGTLALKAMGIRTLTREKCMRHLTPKGKQL